MSLIRKSLTNIVSPSSNFNDDVLTIKQNRVSYEQGFNLNYIEALSGINDSKINNYSSLYLTDIKRDDEIFTFNELVDTQDDYITYIKYRDPVNEYFLYFNSNNTYTFTTTSNVTDVSRVYFEIETLDENLCRIKRRDNTTNYYLTYDGNTSLFYFATSYDAATYPTPAIYKADILSYVLDKQGYALFFKRFNSKTYILGVNATTLQFELIPYTSDFNYLTQQTLFGVSLIDNLIDNKLNTSWVSYDRLKLNSNIINTSKSIFNIKNNNVIHFEYNDIANVNEINVNTFKLKNQHTNKNLANRGNATITTSNNLPAPYFREYTSLITGNNEEIGYDDIGANYVFYNQDYKILADHTTTFTTPSSIFPFTQLNINDTSFVHDGALAAPSIVLADKIFKEIENNDPLQGNYICTWLSGGTNNNHGVWLDRYYFPNIISQQDALSGEAAFTPTFENPVKQIAYNSVSTVNSNPYYDTISNFVILPNETYAYERIGPSTLSEYVSNYPNIIQYDFNSYLNTTGNTIANVSTSISFDGGKVVSIPIEKVNESGSFTLFFEIEGNWKQKVSYLFGSLVDTGFAIYNDNRITPFIYTKSGNNVFVSNINSTVLYTLSFDSPVQDVITTDHLSDYFVTTQNNDVYQIGSDGAIKEKYQIYTNTTPLTTGYVSYINYTKQGNNIHFLTTTVGDVITLDTKTGNVTKLTATPFMSGSSVIRSLYEYNDVVYGFTGEKNLVKDNTLYTLVSGSVIESYNLLVTNQKNVFTVSNSVIEDFNIDDNGNVYVLHDSNKLALLTSNRKLVSDVTLLPGLTSHKIDFVSYYTNKRVFYPIILVSDANFNYSLVSYTPVLSTTPTALTNIAKLNDSFPFNQVFNAENADDIPTINDLLDIEGEEYVPVNDVVVDFVPTAQTFVGASNPDSVALVEQTGNRLFDNFLSQVKRQPLTNYNYYINNTTVDSLNFTLKLKNIYNSLDETTITYNAPLEMLSDFSNTFCIMYDDKEGMYKIYINGNEMFTQVVDKSKYTFNVLLNNSLVFGSVGFHNNLLLSQFVQIPGFLYGDGFSVSGLRYYSSRLTDEQLYGLLLENSGVEDFYLTLPCDQRNNVETLQAIFSFRQPYAKSNTINLLVKNSGITNATLQNELSGAIIQNIDYVLPGDVTVNEVQFINY